MDILNLANHQEKYLNMPLSDYDKIINHISRQPDLYPVYRICIDNQ